MASHVPASDAQGNMLDQLRGLRDRLDRSQPKDNLCGRSIVCTTIAITTYPTTPVACYGVQAVDLIAPEVEGATPTLSTRTGTFLAINLGTAVPPSGTLIICTEVPNAWVFRYDG